MSNDKKDEQCKWNVAHTPYGFSVYITECGKMRLNYTAGFDIYCNACGRRIKIVDDVKGDTNMFNAKQTHSGQYKKYGDFFRVWEIETDMSKEKVLEKCFTELCKKRLPESAEYHKEIRYGTGSHSSDANYYFKGYYTLEEIENGYKFTVCEPYAD